MASTLVKSLRISPELWASVERLAAEAGQSANAFAVNALQSAVHLMEDDALSAKVAAHPLRRPPIVAAKITLPKEGGIQIGPAPVKPGSRLKQPKGKAP